METDETTAVGTGVLLTDTTVHHIVALARSRMPRAKFSVISGLDRVLDWTLTAKKLNWTRLRKAANFLIFSAKAVDRRKGR
jgi:hypothetical protein